MESDFWEEVAIGHRVRHSVPVQQTFTFSAGDPERLDAFLQNQTAIVSRSVVQKHIRGGHVTVNRKKITKTGYALSEDDVVVISLEELPSSSATIDPVDLDLTVLYEDDACMVVDKPRGLTVHPAPTVKEPTLLHGAAWLFKKRKLKFQPSSVLVHRLDKETTGCLLIGKTPEAHLFLQKQFETRTVEKKYLALVYGQPREAKAKIDAPIGRHATERTKMSSLHITNSKQAQTTYETLGSQNSTSLLLCELHTGRTHQIRVHLESIGHPVLGDSTYGSGASAAFAKKLKVDFLCLHAWQLAFDSPASKKRVHVTAELPEDFDMCLTLLGLADAKVTA